MSDYSDIKWITASGTFAPGPHTIYGVILTPNGTVPASVTIQDSTDGTSGTLLVLRSEGTASISYTFKHGRRCTNAIYGVLTGTASAGAEIG